MSNETSASIASIIVLLIIAISTFTGHDMVAIAIITAITAGFIAWAINDTVHNKRATEQAQKRQHSAVRDKWLKEMAKLDEE